MAVLGQVRFQRLTEDGSRFIRKRRLVKQSTMVASSVSQHRYGCVYTAVCLAHGMVLNKYKYPTWSALQKCTILI